MFQKFPKFLISMKDSLELFSNLGKWWDWRSLDIATQSRLSAWRSALWPMKLCQSCMGLLGRDHTTPVRIPGVASLAQWEGLEQSEVGQVGSLTRLSWLELVGHLHWRTSQPSPGREQHWSVSRATTRLSNWPSSSSFRRPPSLLLSRSPSWALSSLASLATSCDLLDLKRNMAWWVDHPRWPCHCLCLAGEVHWRHYSPAGLPRTDPTLHCQGYQPPLLISQQTFTDSQTKI